MANPDSNRVHDHFQSCGAPTESACLRGFSLFRGAGPCPRFAGLSDFADKKAHNDVRGPFIFGRGGPDQARWL